jgi:5-methylcytosine-specific restriction protein A
MHPGCSALVNGRDSKCITHMQAQRKRENEQRDKATAALYGSAWRKARAMFLRANPLCNACRERSLVVPATVVDHIEPHKGDVALFWTRANWQSLCKPCHDRKTANEDGGFGRMRANHTNGA